MKKSINLLAGLLLLGGATQLTARDITIVNTDRSVTIEAVVTESRNKRAVQGLGKIQTSKTFHNVMNGKSITVVLNKLANTENGRERAGVKEVELGPNESTTIRF